MDDLVNARHIMEMIFGKRSPKKLAGRERQRPVSVIRDAGIKEAYLGVDGRGNMRLWRKSDVMPIIKNERERLAEHAAATQSEPPPAPVDEAKGNGLVLKALGIHQAELKTAIDESCAKGDGPEPRLVHDAHARGGQARRRHERTEHQSRDVNRYRIIAVGLWFIQHARTRAGKSGTFQVARNLRKQGVPLPIAIQILARKN